MKKLEDLLHFNCSEADLPSYTACDDRLKEVFRMLCIILNQWGYTPTILEAEDTMMRVIVGTNLRSSKVKNTCTQICKAINCVFAWIPYQITAQYVSDCYDKMHFKIQVPTQQ